MPPPLRHFLAGTTLVLLLALAGACSGDDPEPEAEPSSTSSEGNLDVTIEDQIAQLVEIGITQAEQGDYPTAVVTFNNVLTLEPGNKFALFNLGLIAQTEKQPGKAIRFYDEALATDPTYTPALYNKAIVLEPTDLPAAVDIYEQILTIDPEASTTYLRLSFAYEELDDTAAADEARQKAIELDPSLAEVTELPEQ